jgi:hypothetical protein
MGGGDLAAYARRSLLAGAASPYQDTAATAAVAQDSGRSGTPLLPARPARARALAAEEQPRRGDDPGLASLLHDGLAGLLRDDVGRAVPDPTEQAATLDLWRQRLLGRPGECRGEVSGRAWPPQWPPTDPDSRCTATPTPQRSSRARCRAT